jgi:hypothetical protein
MASGVALPSGRKPIMVPLVRRRKKDAEDQGESDKGNGENPCLHSCGRVVGKVIRTGDGPR